MNTIDITKFKEIKSYIEILDEPDTLLAVKQDDGSITYRERGKDNTISALIESFFTEMENCLKKGILLNERDSFEFGGTLFTVDSCSTKLNSDYTLTIYITILMN